MFPPNDCREDFTSDNCPFDRNMDWGLFKQSLRCKNRTSDVDIHQLTLEEPKSNVNISTFTLSGNGSFCSWKFQTQEPGRGSRLFGQNQTKLVTLEKLTVADLNCVLVDDNQNFKSCQKEVGSHKQTFLMYVVLRMLWTIGDASVFNTMDTLSINLAEKYNGQYNTIFASVVIPGVLAPTVAGFLIRDYKDNPGFHEASSRPLPLHI